MTRAQTICHRKALRIADRTFAIRDFKKTPLTLGRVEKALENAPEIRTRRQIAEMKTTDELLALLDLRPQFLNGGKSRDIQNFI
jgi:hypothetical protein